MLSGVRLLALHRSRSFFTSEDESLEESGATLWIPTTVEKTSIDEMVQTLTGQSKNTDDFERLIVIVLLVHTLIGLSPGSDIHSNLQGQSRARPGPTSTHSHVTLDLPDRLRDGLVSLCNLTKIASLSVHH
jgi:hypothetical protein